MASAALLLLLALAGAPLFAVIAASALLGFGSEEVDPQVVAIEIYRLAEMPVLLAIPLFTFAGYLLGESRAPARLVRVTDALLGWLRGGLAIVSLVACAIFTAFTGASGVTIVALGALLYPALVQAGYPPRQALGLVTAAGSLGVLFAPSLPLILYGVVVQQLGSAPVSINELFLAGLLPGLLMVAMLGALAVWHGRRVPLVGFSWVEARAALWEARWELPLPGLVLGGIYGGLFAVSEAAAVSAVYALVAEVLLYREIALRQLPGIMRESMTLVGGILVILGVSLASTNYLIDAEVPARLFAAMQAHVEGRLTFLVLLNLFLLVLGMILDIFSALVLMVPLLLPVAVGYGVDPVHLGIVFLANLQAGYLTPPVGLNLFIASYRFGQPVMEVYRATLPYLLALLAAVALITFWPGLTLT
jgi:tripartite ATP-independent transporter DctM subunit